ncbi:hypothetical protein G6F56_013752 [Rhizopus delemar]|nr:hypothetical protein G6F56_013752 [Rhizopus delemar]
MAGVDTDFEGEARPQPGIKVGYLAQEPELDPTKTVREAVEEGVGEVLQAQAALDAVYLAYAEEGADFDALAKEQERLEAILAAGDAHTLENQLDVAADALRLPPWDAVVGKLSGEAGHAAARRTDQPPRSGRGVLAGTVAAEVPGYAAADLA